MKPTDLWGVWPTEWTPRVPCRNRVSKRTETDEHGIEWRIDENGDRIRYQNYSDAVKVRDVPASYATEIIDHGREF